MEDEVIEVEDVKNALKFYIAVQEACDGRACDQTYEFICPLCGGRAKAG